MRGETGQFRSLSFRVFALRGSQAGGQKEEADGAAGEERREPCGTRGAKKRDRGGGSRVKFVRAESEGEISAARRTRGAVARILRFPASH